MASDLRVFHEAISSAFYHSNRIIQSVAEIEQADREEGRIGSSWSERRPIVIQEYESIQPQTGWLASSLLPLMKWLPATVFDSATNRADHWRRHYDPDSGATDLGLPSIQYEHCIRFMSNASLNPVRLGCIVGTSQHEVAVRYSLRALQTCLNEFCSDNITPFDIWEMICDPKAFGDRSEFPRSLFGSSGTKTYEYDDVRGRLDAFLTHQFQGYRKRILEVGRPPGHFFAACFPMRENDEDEKLLFLGEDDADEFKESLRKELFEAELLPHSLESNVTPPRCPDAYLDIDQASLTTGPPPCPVVLQGEGKEVIVLGEAMDPLTSPRYAVIKALVEVYPDRLNGPDLATKSGRTGAVKALYAIRRLHHEWAKVIDLPGSKYDFGYGLIHPES